MYFWMRQERHLLCASHTDVEEYLVRPDETRGALTKPTDDLWCECLVKVLSHHLCFLYRRFTISAFRLSTSEEGKAGLPEQSHTANLPQIVGFKSFLTTVDPAVRCLLAGWCVHHAIMSLYVSTTKVSLVGSIHFCAAGKMQLVVCMQPTTIWTVFYFGHWFEV